MTTGIDCALDCTNRVTAIKALNAAFVDPGDSPIIDAEILFRQPEPALSGQCPSRDCQTHPGWPVQSRVLSDEQSDAATNRVRAGCYVAAGRIAIECVTFCGLFIRGLRPNRAVSQTSAAAYRSSSDAVDPGVSGGQSGTLCIPLAITSHGLQDRHSSGGPGQSELS
jgi:hypothetical protein